MSQAKLVFRDGLRADIEVASGHTITFDEPEVDGGTNQGPSPTEMVAASLAACTTLTIRYYANLKEWDLDGLGVEVDTTYEDHRPASYKVKLTMPPLLSAEQHDKIRIIAGKCPVHRTLADALPVEIV